jgi:hypothetical protein
VAVMMAPASKAHRVIALNLCNVLDGALRRGVLICLPSAIPASGHPGPALSARTGCCRHCGRRHFDLYSEHFRLAAEILSPSDTRQEINLKLRFYREAPDNLYTVVIEPRASVEIDARTGNPWSSNVPRT